MITIETIARLPKVDLHLHLDGSLRAETVLDLAHQQGLALPVWTAAEVRGLLEVWGKAHDLAEYLTKFDLPVRLLQTPEALTRVSRELVQDVSRENVRYAEVRFAPWLHVRRGMRLSQAIRAVLDGLCQGEQLLACATGSLPAACAISQDNLTAEVAQLQDVGLAGPGRR